MNAWRLLSTNASNIRDRREFEPCKVDGKKLSGGEKAFGPEKKTKLDYMVIPRKVIPNIDIMSQNSNELESKEMSGRFLSTRLEIRQHCVLPA